jgi:predicted glutamine amidotransferase
MCRWIAYIGKSIYIDTLVTKPAYSLVEQSTNARLSFRYDGSILATNGDGFGVGWYSELLEPALFKGSEPAWRNENLNEVCSHTKARIFMAHIRAASTGAIQRSNAHPFKYKNWLFQHNGFIGHFEKIRRNLQCGIALELFPALQGTTDSETVFLLALTNGLRENPKQAMEVTIAHIRRALSEQGLPFELILSCALSDGKNLYTLRYSSVAKSHSQYYSMHAACMKEINEDCALVPENSVVVVSEPLDQSGEHWIEMPNNAFATIRNGQVQVEELRVAAH